MISDAGSAEIPGGSAEPGDKQDAANAEDVVSLAALSKQLVHAKISEANIQRKLRCRLERFHSIAFCKSSTCALQSLPCTHLPADF